MKQIGIATLMLTTTLMLSLEPARGEPVSQDETIAEMQRELRALREELDQFRKVDAAKTEVAEAEARALRAEVASLRESAVTQPEAGEVDHDLLGADFFKAKGLTLGFYGESKYRMPESGASSFDAHRYVFSPGYEIADWLVFNSELEFEHGGISDGGRRFDGAVELEQFYVDILIDDHFNVRSLGVDLIPVGRINMYHEPTLFYSTERPELYREIIPSTWMEGSMSVFGQISETLDYRLMVSSGLNDFDPDDTSASGQPNPGVTASSGMRNARPNLRGAFESKLAVSGRLHFNGIEGLDTSTSFYYTPTEGFNQEPVNMTLWDIEALYRVPGTGLEFRGDFAYWWIQNSENLIANNNGTATDDVGDHMYGWYVEGAYHWWPEAWRKGLASKMDLVPFLRFSQIRTQVGLEDGGVALDNGTTNRDFITTGLAWFLNESFVLKGDYRHNLDGTDASKEKGSSQDYFQVGVGMAF